jgi:hypothetical protein
MSMPRLCSTQGSFKFEKHIVEYRYIVVITHFCCTFSIVNGNLPPIYTIFSLMIKFLNTIFRFETFFSLLCFYVKVHFKRTRNKRLVRPD